MSRRHCLLDHGKHGLRLLDMNSTSGTSINETKLPPNQWVSLNDGDMIRCGKVLFAVGLKARSSTCIGPELEPAGTLLSGAAWQEADVADFLAAEDDVQRERRYQRIRSRDGEGGEMSAAEDVGADLDDSDDFDTDDFPEFSDDFSGDSSSPDSSSPRPDDTSSKSPIGIADKTAATQTSKKTSAKSKQPVQPPRLPKSKRLAPTAKPRRSLASFSLGHVDGADRWKLAGAILLAIAVTGFAGWNGYQLYTGPNIRVLHGID